MSYNTRRTGVTGRGQTTQVNYHQQPSRSSGAVTQQTRNPGYTTTQSSNYNTSSQPAYSTQQPGYTTAPPMPSQVPAPPTQPQQPQAPVQQPPLPSQQPPATPILKQEPLTPANTPKMDTTSTPATENGDGTQTKSFWKKRPYVKLSSKVKRARQNAKLRRVLNPKNALTFLNELRPGAVKFVVREETGWGFVASVDIDGKTFSGHGLTISKAKVQASEQALRFILLEQMAKSQTPTSATTNAVDDNKDETKKKTEEEMEVENKEGEEGDEPKPKRARTEPLEDEMPWGSLAAFALHKLFEEWQKEGDLSHSGPTQEKYDEDVGEDSYYRRPGPADFGYPRRLPGPGMFGRGRGFGPLPGRGGYNGPRRLPPPPAATYLGGPPRPAVSMGAAFNTNILPMKKIPEDANKRHPVMLLNQLKPGVIYNETKEGEFPHVSFKITAIVDGKEYIGRGKSKKEAKKVAAKNALAPMGIVYNDDDNN